MAGLGGLVLALLLALDQLGNVLILGGDPDMTISTSCGLRLQAEDASLRTRYFCRPVCAALHWIDENHCREAKE